MKINENDARWTSDTHFRHPNVIKFDKSPFWSDRAKELADQIDDEKDKEIVKRLKVQERLELLNNVREQDEHIIENWNKVVEPDQLVFHLGDVTFSRNVAEVLEILNRLNGRIILINGNHEQTVHSNPEVKKHFYKIYDYKEVFVGKQRICMFHYPIHEWNQTHRGAWMLHGHTHITDDYDDSFKICNVGTMNWNYSPISYQQLQIFMAAKNNKTHH